jgi:cytoskeletal protein RodZ
MRNKMTSRIKLFLTMIALWPSIALAQNLAPEVAASEASSQSHQSTSPINEPENEMLLVCDGSTFTVVPTSQTNALVTDSHGNMVVGSATSSAPANVGFQVQLRIIGEKAEMNVPAIAAPAIKGGNSGWYKVKNLVVGEHEITGKVSFNFIASSNFRVDRRTGKMTTKAGFSGTCRKEDLQKRAF